MYDVELIRRMNGENEPKFFEKLVFNTASYLAPKSVITSF